MGFRPFALILAAAIAATADPSLSQSTGSRSQAVASAHLAAACLIAKNDGSARRLLAEFPESEASTAITKRVLSDSCALSLGPDPDQSILRGAIAEALLKSDFPVVGSKPRRIPVPVYPALTTDAYANAPPPTRQALQGIELGACVAAARPHDASALMQTAPISPEERAALATLLPTIEACLFEGASLALTPTRLRGYLAEGAYRSAVEQSVPGGVRPSVSVGTLEWATLPKIAFGPLPRISGDELNDKLRTLILDKRCTFASVRPTDFEYKLAIRVGYLIVPPNKVRRLIVEDIGCREFEALAAAFAAHPKLLAAIKPVTADEPTWMLWTIRFAGGL